ncbi:hypothetical protein MKX03_009335 [Papaver bracteatum]|nr:hypothetical protein MKX03_009335 [Papaver bracteatum]
MTIQQVWETIMKFVMVLSVLVYSASATNYTVGGESGWALNSDMQTWSSEHTFNGGDTLVFVYKPVHSVLEVNEFAYEACILDNPIEIFNRTSTVIKLGSWGTRYFICGTPGHCGLGLKVKILVPYHHHNTPRDALPPRNSSLLPPHSAATKTSQKLSITLISVVVMLMACHH